MYMRPYGAPTICGLAGAPTPDFAAFAGVGQSPSSTSLRSERGPVMCLRVLEVNLDEPVVDESNVIHVLGRAVPVVGHAA